MKTRSHHVLLTAALVAFSGGLIQAQGAEAKPPDTQDLIQKLGDDSYQVRREAERALRTRGKDVAEELRKASTEHADEEVQWRARRLLRQIESGDEAGLAPRRPGGTTTPDLPRGPYRIDGGNADAGEQFDRVFEQLERDFGVRIPRARFFGGDFFRGIEEQMEGARRSMAMGIPGGVGQSFSMRMNDKGVRIEIQEKGEDCKSETKVYEAPDVRTFREKYPEIAERYLRNGEAMPRGFTWNLGDPPPVLDAPAPGGWMRLRPFTPPAEAATDDANDRLGVYVEAVPEQVREFLGLTDGSGLRVQSVVDDSVAAKAGIETGDILLQVAGHKIGAVEDVRAALGTIDPGKPFDIEVNRRGVAKTLHGTRPDAAPKPVPAERKLEPRRVR